MRRNSSFGAWSATTMPEIGVRGNLVVKGTGTTGRSSAVGTGTTNGLAARNFNARNVFQKARRTLHMTRAQQREVLVSSPLLMSSPRRPRLPRVTGAYNSARDRS